ncbi:bifunctional nuclease family protein [Candidatus Woesearchaeota archaeon]|nr:bifunctional nuclease family protein [Candidatus Woesearchaeota archaeon]
MIFWWQVGLWWRSHWGKVLLSVFLFVAGFSAIYFFQDSLTGLFVRTPTDSLTTPLLSLGDPFDLTDYTQVEVDVLAEGVLFKKDCKGIWLAMPYEKTYSIKRGEVGAFDVRPTQHDILFDILTNYKITMHYARIERIQHDFFYATVLLEDNDKLLQLDTRPSDALALAKRLKVPVYMSSKLLQQQGRDICNDQRA